MTGDFKSDGLMFAIAGAAIVFVIVQSVFFIAKSWKRGKEIGIDTKALKNTVTSSALFTVAPAISILATVFALGNALGIVLPWIRLSVIGNLAYETTAAQTTLDFWGLSLSNAVGDEKQFATIAVAMTIGSIAPLLMIPFVCKPLQKKVGSAMNSGKKSDRGTSLGDVISAAAFIGIISAFVAREINGMTVATKVMEDSAGEVVKNAAGEIVKIKTITGSAGLVSILVLISAMIIMLVLTILCNKFKLTKLEPFTMPIAMFAAMGIAILLMSFIPKEITDNAYWYEINKVVEIING